MAVATRPTEKTRFFTSSPRALLINGKFEQAESGKTFDTLNPATAEVLPWPALPARPDWPLRLARSATAVPTLTRAKSATALGEPTNGMTKNGIAKVAVIEPTVFAARSRPAFAAICAGSSPSRASSITTLRSPAPKRFRAGRTRTSSARSHRPRSAKSAHPPRAAH